MSFFDRIFGRKVSPTNLDSAPPPEESGRSIAAVQVSFNSGVEEQQAPLTTGITSLHQVPSEDPQTLLTNLPQVGVGVVETKEEISDWQCLPDVGIAPSAQLSTYVNLHISSELTVRELALLRITIALREILTERLFHDLASSKLEIARLCGETMDRMRIESAADKPSCGVDFRYRANTTDDNGSDLSGINQTPDLIKLEAAQGEITLTEKLKNRIDQLELENAEIRSKESEGLGQIRFELSQQQQQIVKDKEELEKRIKEADAQARRLAEREAIVWKNFSELQRREKLLADPKPVYFQAETKTGSALTEENARLRAKIDSDDSSAKKREAALVEEIKNLKARVNSGANNTLKEQLDQADLSIQKLLKAKNELEISLEAERRTGISSLKRTKRESHFDTSLIAVTDHRIIDWMLDDASPEQASVDHGYLSLTGDGPWLDQQIRELMESAGFSLWMLPDADVNHVVVGRYSWDVSALEQQIGEMEGRNLRIYSQEMWFAKLTTGRDPFDSGDHDLLMAFAKGHPALEYLIDRDAPWPEVSSRELVVGDVVVTEGIEFGVSSPLRNFGYQVGGSSGLSVNQRRALLVKFLEAKDLAFDVNSSAEYRSHWGRPRSVQRLFRVASHIKWLIGWQGKSPYREQANEDWRVDLQWLKKTYYKPNLHKFRWPGV